VLEIQRGMGLARGLVTMLTELCRLLRVDFVACFNVPIEKFQWRDCRNSWKEFEILPNHDLNPEHRDMKCLNIIHNKSDQHMYCSRTLLEHLYASIVGEVRLSVPTLLNIAGRTRDQVSRVNWRSVKEWTGRMVLC
jgi:hypothetical protein